MRSRPQVTNAIVELEVESLKSASLMLRPLNVDLVCELARSIENGELLEPIIVRPWRRGYEVVSGNHRLAAYKRLGRQRIPSIIKDYSDEEAFLARLSENLLRNAYINPLEEAQGYRMLVTKGWSINAIGRKVGKCDSYVCERLALLDRLGRSIHSRIASGSRLLTASHAELLSRIEDKAKQNEVADLIERKRLSVRSLEDMLYGVPPPCKIQVEVRNGELWVRIPNEFSRSANVVSGQAVYMYVRGRKLILENLENPVRRRKRTRAQRILFRAPDQPVTSPSAALSVAQVAHE